LVSLRFLYLGATRQVRLQETQARQRLGGLQTMAPRDRRRSQGQAAVDWGMAEDQFASYKEGATSGHLNPVQYDIPDALAPDRWKEHGRLGEEGFRAIHSAYTLLTEKARFNKEMQGKPYEAVSSRPTTKPEIGIVQHVEHAKEPVEALNVLEKILK
jgi:hypothetical protein